MKKRILAVMMTLAMVISVFAGCGREDSSYFKEMKEMCKITTGAASVVMDIAYKGEDMSDMPDFMTGADGNLALSLKMDAAVESQEKAGIKISLKMGQDEEFSEFTTLVVDSKKLYIAVDPMIAFVQKVDADTASELETGLAQMGISGAVSVDVEQLMNAVGGEYPSVSDDAKKSAYDLMNDCMDALEKNFGVLEGRDGDDYTLTLNGENAEKAMDGLMNFLNNDAEGLMESLKAFVSDFYGEDSEFAKTAAESYDEIISQLPDTVDSIGEKKDDTVQLIKDNDIDIISKIQVNGKEGKREARLTLETGNIKSEDGSEMNISYTGEVQEKTCEIKDMIPENASDVTTMLITMINQLQSMNSDSPAIIGGEEDASDLIME